MSLTAIEISEIIKFNINNNIELAKNGKRPMAIEITGNSGIGKTSVTEQTVSELGLPLVKRNLADMTLDDLVGYPITLHEMCLGGLCKWIVKEGIEAYVSAGWTFSGQTEMSYSLPMWIRPHVNSNTPIVLFLDDHNRAALNLIQATMEICSRGEYLSWKLPVGSTVILSSNPDDGSYMVTSEDEAHQTRKLKYEMRFDIDAWAAYAEKAKIDPRAINFMIKHPEIISGTNDIDEKGKKLAKGNVRLWTMFFETIGGIEDWKHNLKLIMNLAGSNFPEEHILLFSSFINESMDKLPEPKYLFNMKKNEDEIMVELDSLIMPDNDPTKFRTDIASILSKRMMNYVLSNVGSMKDAQLERYARILERGMITEGEGEATRVVKHGLFNADLLFLALRKLAGNSRLAKHVVLRDSLTASLSNK